MSNGDYLFAFRSRAGSLHYTIRAPPHEAIVKLADEDFEVDLSDVKGRDEVASIVATKELTIGEVWVSIPSERLMIFKDGLPYLAKEQWSILAYVRRSPHRVSIRDVSIEVSLEVDEAVRCITYLREIGMLRQDGRDVVPPTHPDATFYTNPDIRRIIDSILNYLFP